MCDQEGLPTQFGKLSNNMPFMIIKMLNSAISRTILQCFQLFLISIWNMVISTTLWQCHIVSHGMSWWGWWRRCCSWWEQALWLDIVSDRTSLRKGGSWIRHVTVLKAIRWMHIRNVVQVEHTRTHWHIWLRCWHAWCYYLTRCVPGTLSIFILRRFCKVTWHWRSRYIAFPWHLEVTVKLYFPCVIRNHISYNIHSPIFDLDLC